MLRRTGTLVLALMLGVFAAIPHEHNLGESILAETSHVELEACDTPNLHLHAADEAHHHACVACVRQHHGGAPALIHVPIAGLLSSPAAATHDTVLRFGALFLIPGRGPPR